MKEVVIAKRYAEAFIAFGRESIGMPKVIEDFASLSRTLFDNPEFRVFLLSPEISFTEKCDFVDRVLRNDFSSELRHFLKLLIDKRRINLIGEIADYIRLNYVHEGALNAVLKSSYPVDLELIASLKNILEKKYQKKFNLYLGLDAYLKGGVQLVVGNTVVDGSLRRRLEELREKLKAARVIHGD
jgi:F-type H+-transporting ATPase subunit delta